MSAPSTAPVEHAVSCGECSAPMRLRQGTSGRGPFYGCSRFPACRGTHGAHPDGRPLGVPANAATKAARIRAHAAFDPLWKSGEMRRPDAYVWMQKALGMTTEQAHIANFTEAQCALLIAACEAREPADPDTLAAREELRTALSRRFGDTPAARRSARAWLGAELGCAGEVRISELDAGTCRRLART